MQDHSKVSVGITSIIGWGVAAAGALPLVVKTISEGKAQFLIGGPEKWLALLSVVALGITNIGRYVQSAIKTKGSA